MAKVLPKKFFPGRGTATISLRKVDKWAELDAKRGLHFYFDTWQEARQHMVDRAEKAIKRMERDLASEKRHLAKVLLLKEPQEVAP